MLSLKLQASFRRLCIDGLRDTNLALHRNFSFATQPLFFKLTPYLCAEPLKKKRRVDPMILKMREDRRKKKLEKEIKKLERVTQQLKPLDECEVPLAIVDHEKSFRRPPPRLGEAELTSRVLLQKAWTAYKYRRHLMDHCMIDRIMCSQQRALDMLRQESEELYQMAIQQDEALIPFQAKGPVETPPIKGYSVPDGEYTDVSRKWE